MSSSQPVMRAAGSQSSDLEISIKSLSKQYAPNAPLVLENIDLQVRAGEFVCLLGASGCGKSTLLALLAGLETPTVGEVHTSSRAALMFQEPALLPWLTAGKNVELALTFAGVPKGQRKEQARELLSLVHLDRSYDQRPHELSGGMRQRVAIARSLAMGRSILLMDEPFAALDEITRAALEEDLLAWTRARGLTVVFVTHSIPEAVFLSTKIVVMSPRPGKIHDIIECDFPADRTLDIRETPEFLDVANRVRQGLREGHSYVD